MNKILFLLSVVAVLAVFTAFSNSDVKKKSLRVAFYNVENLFDTLDDPNTLDEEFTPNSKKKYTEERYADKLSKLAKGFDAMDYPDLIGVCEVEKWKTSRCYWI